eukprot:s53_g29.t1
MSGAFDLEKEMAEAMARVKSKHPGSLADVKSEDAKVFESDETAEVPEVKKPNDNGAKRVSIFDDDINDASLGKSKSVEDLVCSTMCSGSTSLSLNPILFEHFDEGWDPDNYGRFKLEEATVLWLKGLDTITLPDVMPGLVSNALQSFQSMKASTARLAEGQETANKMKNAAGKTAEAKFQSLLNEMLAKGTDPVTAQEGLDARKKALEKWVANRRDQADAKVKEMEMEHFAVRDAFEKVVAELVTHSHLEYKSIPKRPKAAAVLLDESALFEELDMELNGCFDEVPPGNVLKPAQGEQFEAPDLKPDDGQRMAHESEADQGGLSEPLAETIDMTQAPAVEPSVTAVANTVTGAYEAMKEVIEKSNIPAELRNLLMGSVHQCVTTTLAKATVPMPEGDQPCGAAPGDDQPHHDPKDEPPQKLHPSGDLPAPNGGLHAPKGDAPSRSGGGEPRDVPPQGEESTSDANATVVIDPPESGGLAAAKAVELALQRKDTSQLALQRANTVDLEKEELAKCAVLQEDGSILYKNKKGKLETLEEREKRLAHNSYVAFSRSFDGLSILLC